MYIYNLPQTRITSDSFIPDLSILLFAKILLRNNFRFWTQPKIAVFVIRVHFKTNSRNVPLLNFTLGSNRFLRYWNRSCFRDRFLHCLRAKNWPRRTCTVSWQLCNTERLLEITFSRHNPEYRPLLS